MIKREMGQSANLDRMHLLVAPTNRVVEEFLGSHFHLMNPLWFMNSQMRPIQV